MDQVSSFSSFQCSFRKGIKMGCLISRNRQGSDLKKEDSSITSRNEASAIRFRHHYFNYNAVLTYQTNLTVLNLYKGVSENWEPFHEAMSKCSEQLLQRSRPELVILKFKSNFKRSLSKNTIARTRDATIPLPIQLRFLAFRVPVECQRDKEPRPSFEDGDCD